MNDLPLVTLAGICHKHEKYVIETLESFRSQTYPNLQLLVLNNIKGDESSRLIREWVAETGTKIEVIENDAPLPVTANFNILVDKAKGEFIQLLACDDVLLDEYIERQLDFLQQKGPEYGLVYADVFEMGGDGRVAYTYFDFIRKKIAEVFKSDPDDLTVRQKLSWRCYLPAPSTFYRTAVLKEIKGVDTKFDIEDWPLYLEFIRRGIGMAENPTPLMKHRYVETSLGRNVDAKRLTTYRAIFFEYRDVLVPMPATVAKWFTYALRLGKDDRAKSASFLIAVARWAGPSYWRVYARSIRRHLNR